MTTILSTTETKNIMLEHLRERYPGVRFRARIQRSSNSTSLTVIWENGPAKTEVQSLISKYASRGYDHHEDNSTVRDLIIDGKTYTSGADFVHCDRHLTKDFLDQIRLTVFQPGQLLHGLGQPDDLKIIPAFGGGYELHSTEQRLLEVRPDLPHGSILSTARVTAQQASADFYL